MNLSKFKYIIKKILIKNTPARNFLNVRDDDVFIVSFPRSGNTWLRFLIGTLWANKKVDWINMENIVPDIYRCSNKHLSKLSSPRLLKSHHPYDSRYKKVIYIIRDPRDIAVSYYKFMQKFNLIKYFGGTFDTYFNYFIDGNINDFGSWKSNIESWINTSKKPEKGILIVRYEDIIKNTEKELKLICKFLKIHPSNEQINNAIYHASRENMSKLEYNQKEESELLKKSQSMHLFVNKEKQKSNLLKTRHVARIEKEFSVLMKHFKYI